MRRIYLKTLESVGAVEAGDNPDAHIMLFKHRTDHVNAESVETTERQPMPDFDLSSLEPEVAEAVQAHIEAEVAKALEGDEPEVVPADLPEPVAKAITEKDETIAKQAEALDGLSAKVAKMEDDRLTERFQTRAEALTSVLGNGEGAADVLKKLHLADPEAYAKLDERLGATAKILDSGDALMLKELGTASDGGSVEDRITAIAKEIKSENPELTMLQARAEAWDRNPELKTQSREAS